MKSPETIRRYKDARWSVKRKIEESVQAAIVRAWNVGWKEMGAVSPKLLWANGSYLGKPTSFFVQKRLFDLGYDEGAPRLTLAVARGGFLGLHVWILAMNAPESAEINEMQEALDDQGYGTITVRSAPGGIRAITEYLAGP